MKKFNLKNCRLEGTTSEKIGNIFWEIPRVQLNEMRGLVHRDLETENGGEPSSSRLHQ